jgi:hypothetical protein
MPTLRSIRLNAFAAAWIFVAMTSFETGLAAQRERGSVEITGFSGAMFSRIGPAAQASENGVSSIGNPGRVHSLFGGGVAVSLVQWLWLYGDSSYVRLGHISATAGSNSAAARESLINFDGGTRFQFFGRSRINPYVNLGLGLYHTLGSASASCGGLSPSVGTSCFSLALVTVGAHTFAQVTGGAATYVPPRNGVSLHVGGGMRVRISRRWGVRMSVEYADFEKLGTTNPVIVSAGVFFQTK